MSVEQKNVVMMKIEDFFPYPEIRDAQRTAIDFCIQSLADKRYVIIEAGTGVGKSAIGLAASRMLCKNAEKYVDFGEGTYFLTTQKILQDQYISDFGKDHMRSIKSSSNYQCSYHKRNTCQESQRLLRNEEKGSRFFKACTFSCKYKNAKQQFLESSESVTNFPYFLTEATFSGKITPRDVLVIDEAHNIEAELSNFIEITISERFVKYALKMRWPDRSTQFQVVKWIREVYFNKIKSQLSHMETTLKNTGLKDRLSDFKALAKQYDMLKSHVGKIETFLNVYNNENWVMDLVPARDRAMRKFIFKPIDVSPFAKGYLFRLGRKVIMMSATILDHETFCRSLGIDRSDVAFISIPSPFPVQHRPIFICPVGSMNASNIDQTLPKMADAVKEILKEHKGQKGIIHCHTYKIANYLAKNIRSKRLLIHDGTSRDEILRKHIASKDDTVLLSPSMSEGVDLRNDLSRFQIVMKIPYPYLGDPLIKKRMNKWDGWYSMQTAKRIVQSVGRSIRSMDDQAVTYILDADWSKFFYRNRKMFPDDFKSCLT